MRPIALFGLAALIPAALNASPSAALTLLLPTCAGAVQAIAVPLRPGAPPRQDQPCCATACHAGGSRKRFPCRC